MKHNLKTLFTTSLFVFLFLGGICGVAQPTLPFAGKSIIDGSAITVGAGTKNLKGVVVVFLSAKCPCSDSHAVELESLKRDFSNFQFVGVHSNMDEDLESSRAYFQSKKLPFPIIQDENAKLADQFKAYKTPHAYVLDLDGKILYQGGVTNSARYATANEKFLREALEDIVANRKVRKPEGRTLGCVIARSR